jgi:hypothetical protein
MWLTLVVAGALAAPDRTVILGITSGKAQN